MTSKRTAVFGIYPTSQSAENAIDVLTRAGFPVADVSVLVPETLGSKDMGTVKATKARKEQRQGQAQALVLGGALGLRTALVFWPFPVLDHSSRQGPLWLHWRASVSEE